MLVGYKSEWKQKQRLTQYEQAKQAYLMATDEELRVHWGYKLKALERQLKREENACYR